MRNRMLPIILLIVGIVVLGVVAVVFILQQGDEEPTETETPGEEGNGLTIELPIGQPDAEATPDRTVDVVVSLQTVRRGWQMTENELTTDTRLSADVGPNAITDPEQIIGLYARHEIFQGETLTMADFVSDPRLVGQEDFGPASLVPTGWLGIAIPMDRLSSVAYGLAAGDTIDVLMSFTFLEVDETFQTLLQNSAAVIVESTDDESGEVSESIIIMDPFGRFEQLPTGDIAHIFPSESQRPFNVSMLLQNARVIQVGTWMEPAPIALPTATRPLDAPTPTPGGPPPTPTPLPPDVLVVALPPQQQLFLKYALEANADIDYALRNPNDAQINNVQNVDLAYVLTQFGFDVPLDFNFVLETDLGGDGTAPQDGAPAGEETEN